jgi:hypothetical protein
MQDIPHCGSVFVGASGGVANVQLVVGGQTYRRVITAVDGQAPVGLFGYFTGPASLTAQGANTAGAHVTTFHVDNWNGAEEWIGTIEVITAFEPVVNDVGVTIKATLVRYYPF